MRDGTAKTENAVRQTNQNGVVQTLELDGVEYTSTMYALDGETERNSMTGEV